MKTATLALAAALALPTVARADVYVRSPWGFMLVLPTGPYAYGPGRIPPGFRAPPTYDPYARTIAEQFRPGLVPGPPPPALPPALAPLPPPPVSKDGPPPKRPPATASRGRPGVPCPDGCPREPE